jgi:hypothetical protein
MRLNNIRTERESLCQFPQATRFLNSAPKPAASLSKTRRQDSHSQLPAHPFWPHLARSGKPTSGIIKDVVNVPARKVVEVNSVADNPGLTLLHGHMQEHMDFGFMNLVKYI